jgi:hypothetical protein
MTNETNLNGHKKLQGINDLVLDRITAQAAALKLELFFNIAGMVMGVTSLCLIWYFYDYKLAALIYFTFLSGTLMNHKVKPKYKHSINVKKRQTPGPTNPSGL